MAWATLWFFFWDWYFKTCDGNSHKMSRLFHFVVRESNLIPSLLMPYHRPCPTYRERAIHVAVVWIICFLRFISHLDSKKIIAHISTDRMRNCNRRFWIAVWTLPWAYLSIPWFLCERWFNHDFLLSRRFRLIRFMENLAAQNSHLDSNSWTGLQIHFYNLYLHFYTILYLHRKLNFQPFLSL